MSLPSDYWYEHRHELEEGQEHLTQDGQKVKLVGRVPGDGTQWYVEDWVKGYTVRVVGTVVPDHWSREDSKIEPGDLMPPCTCPKECDCQDYAHGLVSQECPEHNVHPNPNPECPLHVEYADDDLDQRLPQHVQLIGSNLLGWKTENGWFYFPFINRPAKAMTAEQAGLAERLHEALFKVTP